MRYLRQILLLSIVLFCMASVSSGNERFGGWSSESVVVPSVSIEGLIIDSIIIDNRNIYNTDDKRYSKFLFKAANKLHKRTRRAVIARESLLKVGDPFVTDLANETSRNLRQRFAIYDAWIETEVLSNNHLLVRIVTIDQWSLEVGIDLRREASLNNYRFRLAESNFGGNNQFISFNYYVQEQEENFITLSFSESRFMGKPLGASLSYSNDPRNKFRVLNLSHPYFNRDQRFALKTMIADHSGRRDIFEDDSLVSRSHFDADRFVMDLIWRHGSYNSKTQYDLQYAYVNETNTNDADSSLIGPGEPPVDSLFHSLWLELSMSDVDFIELRRIDGFGFTEDVIVGRGFALAYGGAFNRDSTLYNNAGIAVGFARYRNHGLAIFTGGSKLWYSHGNSLRHRLSLTGHYYNTHFNSVTFAMRAVYSSDTRLDEENTMLLGGTTGLRGYDKYFRTGNRRAVANIEGRFSPKLEILSVLIGGALFLDTGRTFKKGEDLTGKDFYFSAGFGLRLSPERSSERGLLRVDFAYSENVGWAVSLSSGQFFSLPQSVFP